MTSHDLDKLWLDSGDPIAEIIVASGLRGIFTALTAMVAEWMPRRHRHVDNLGHPSPPTPAQRRRSQRRGSIVGLSVGVPFVGSFIALCLITDQSVGYTMSFPIVLIGMSAVAIRSLRATATASTR